MPPVRLLAIFLLLTAPWFSPAEAEPAERIYRIGYLSASSAAADHVRFAAFIRAMQELGYSQGKNLAIERLYAST